MTTARFAEDYAAYLEAFRLSELPGPPSSTANTICSKPNWKLLLALEDEFGQLLPNRTTGWNRSPNRLLIDLDSLEVDDDEEDGGDDGFVFWKN
jgi:hypothetical protein